MYEAKMGEVCFWQEKHRPRWTQHTLQKPHLPQQGWSTRAVKGNKCGEEAGSRLLELCGTSLMNLDLSCRT
jgi:hypothetical protein